jgi:hypothetical protein
LLLHPSNFLLRSWLLSPLKPLSLLPAKERESLLCAKSLRLLSCEA